MDTNRLKRFATEARSILMQGVAHRLTALGFLPNGKVTEEPQQQGGGATFMGDTVTQDFYNKWYSLRKAVTEKGITEIAEEAAYTWFNRMVAIRIMVKNGLASPVLEYESEEISIPIIVSEARQGRMPEMDDDSQRKLTALLDDDSKTNEQFALLIVAYCHSNPVINSCFGHISDYTELLLPANILAEGGFVNMLNNTEFISEKDFESPELIGWLYQFYISEKKDDVFASFKKGKKAEAKDIPAATQIFTPNWIVKYMVQNTVGRIYLDNNPYSDIKDSMQYLVVPEEPTPADAIFQFDDIHDLTCADLACGSGHILNECFDLLYQLYIEEGYSRKNAIEDIFKFNLTGVDLDTRAKQLAQFALLMKACQKDASFADAHCMPKVLDMPKPYDAEAVSMSLDSACLKFMGGYETVAGEMLAQDFELLMDANNLGSIMKFNDDEDYLAMLRYHYEDWTDGGIEDCPVEIQALIPGVELILTLTKKYAALIANPPYMGSGNMNKELGAYVQMYYKDAKADLYSVFMQMMISKLKSHGIVGCVTMETWMFLSSFEKFRENLVLEYSILSVTQLGWHVMGIAFGTSISILKNTKNIDNIGEYSFFSFEDLDEFKKTPLTFPIKDKMYRRRSQRDFLSIPSTSFGYWVPDKIIDAFKNRELITLCETRCGMSTGNNAYYVRMWHELSNQKIGYSLSHEEASKSIYKWFPYDNAGGYRKWYGNLTDVVNWENDGYELQHTMDPTGKRIWAHNLNLDKIFKLHVGWSDFTSGINTFRIYEEGCLLSSSSNAAYFYDENHAHLILAFSNSKIFSEYKKILNPTFHFMPGNFMDLPFAKNEVNKKGELIKQLSKKSIRISRQDWDSYETSWDYTRSPLYEQFLECMEDELQNIIPLGTSLNEINKCAVPVAMHPLSTCMHNYKDKWEANFMRLHENEEELNRQFIEIYGLEDELTPDVPLDEITILQQGEISIENDKLVWHDDVIIKQFVSYAVGCMMGRYSVDAPGLILANQGDGINEYNEKVPNSRFEIDDDGIIPLMASDSDFSDNATLRFKQWLTVAFGDEHLVENLNFIEAALGKSIDDYFVKDFWKDHKKMYQNRPIYWLFSSKKGAFQCAVYMHRMNPYTAEKIRTDYLLPHIEWLVQKQNEMEANAANLSTAERKKLDNIRKQIDECREYHDRLHVIADEQIAFDLDDGVVVNYAKFGDVLAKLK